MQDIALRLTCLSSKTLQQQYKIQSNPVQMRPLTSKNKFTCTSWHQKTVSHMTAVFSSASRLPVLRKNKTVFHITAVLHITVVFAINCVVSFVWFLFEIRHAKQCWFHHAKTKIRLHIPPLNSTGGVRRRAKKNGSTCHANFFKKSMHMQVKKTFLFGCSMHRANKHTQGSFLPARTAAKMALASSLLYAPVWVQFTSYIPACLSHSHQPSKLQKPAEALQKDKYFAYWQHIGGLHSSLAQKHFSIKLQTTLFQDSFRFVSFQMLLFRGHSHEREFPSIRYLETLSMIPFHDLSASDSTCAAKFLRGDPELHDLEACTCTQW